MVVSRIDYDDLMFLGRSARSAFRAEAMGQPERKAVYHPDSLKGLRGAVHLTLRRNGAVKAEAESEEMDAVDASIAAGTLLALDAAERKFDIADGGDRLGIEFEWLSSREYLQIDCFEKPGVWSEALLHSFEPAEEGIGVELRGKRGRTRPSEITTKNLTPDVALAAAEASIDLKSIHKLRFEKDIRYFRFWSEHLWQPNAKELPIVLHRGDSLVSTDAVSREGLDAAIARVGQYLVYRQNNNGEFSHEYVPSAGTYTSGNSARVQLRALEGLAIYAFWTKDRNQGARASHGIDTFKKHLEPLVVGEKQADGTVIEKELGVVLAPAGHQGHLEITCRLLLAMTLSLNPGEFERDRDRLVNGLLALQTDLGVIAMAADEGDANSGPSLNDTDCCRALHALALVDSMKSDDRITSAVHRGIRYYEDKCRAGLEPAAAAALVRALCLHYAKSNDARVSDMAFFLADRFASLQLTELNYPYPEMLGAINVKRPGEVGADTGIYLMALGDAAELADRIGDRERSLRYRKAVAGATRFIMQLEVREAGCFFIRSRRDALGGIRSALWNGRLRADHTALGLEALIRARTVLFGSRAE
ncbi:MAG: hypothetical protein IPK83_06055 [Planctomycetes bacterium]|nr:hypothetical protein [Planctomycetota bacterium]